MLGQFVSLIVYFIFFLIISLIFGSTLNQGIVIFLFYNLAVLSAMFLHRIRFEPGLFFSLVVATNFSLVPAVLIGIVLMIIGFDSYATLFYQEPKGAEKTRYAKISFIAASVMILVLTNLINLSNKDIRIQGLMALLFFLLFLPMAMIEMSIKQIEKPVFRKVFSSAMREGVINLILTCLMILVFGNSLNSFLSRPFP
jgi:hypothetical protein